jgi:hypothetical protein
MKNRPLGTQAAPACEGGVLIPVRLMTADCSTRLVAGARCGVLGTWCFVLVYTEVHGALSHAALTTPHPAPKDLSV